MRIALLSDIHGNITALDAVLSDIARRGPFDQLIAAGDLVWAGPRPAEVVDRIRDSGAIVVQGNTDAFFGCQYDNAPLGKHEERFAAQLAWMQAQLGPERVAYLSNLPFSHRLTPAEGQQLLVVHANPIDLDRPITPLMTDTELDELLLDNASADCWRVLAFGHLHIPFIRQWRQRLLVNVASAGLPMDGDPRAAYAILSWNGHEWQAEHHRVLYNVPMVAHEMRSGGLPRGKHFAARLMAARYSIND